MGRKSQVRILGIVDRIHQPLAALPEERGTLPNVILRQELNDRGLALGIKCGEEGAGTLLTCEVFVFIRRAGFEDSDQMLEGALAGGHGFGCANGVRNMAFELDALLFRLIGNREVSLARSAGLSLDKVDSAALEHVDGLAPVLGSCDRDTGLVLGLRAIQHGARDNHARAEEPVRCDLAAGVQHRIEYAAHIPDARNAIGKQKRKDEVGAIGGGVVEIYMGVHVPKTRNEKLAAGIDHLSRDWLVFGGRSDVGYAISIDCHCGVGLRPAVRDVDERDVSDGESLRASERREDTDSDQETWGDSHRSWYPVRCSKRCSVKQLHEITACDNLDECG